VDRRCRADTCQLCTEAENGSTGCKTYSATVDRWKISEMRDHRQLLIHRHKLVQIRTRVKNELQHLMLNQGMQKKQKLWSEEGRAALASLPLEPWADRRRRDLLNLLSMLDGQLEKLSDALTQWPDTTRTCIC
jgi:hypothetical protein